MKKKKIGKGRDQKRKLLRSLAASAIVYEKIQTTEARAKVTRSVVERLITKGKKEDLHNKRQVFSALPNNAARKVIEVLGPRYKERAGGYTRIIRIGKYKDGMPKVMLELV
ncbi:MAG: 50S ribosomal protein L17 [Candidatus Doudnabacteria bacterium]|nr:50S ribosomal protein L17 [Candidatus Doudnabacteria bacterium]